MNVAKKKKKRWYKVVVRMNVIKKHVEMNTNENRGTRLKLNVTR